MAFKKINDLAVKIGEYESGGQTKGKWQNVGAIMEDDKGGKFIMLERWFNPAGVPFKDGSQSILISIFEPKDKQTTQDSHGKAKSNGYQPQPKDDGEEIPF